MQGFFIEGSISDSAIYRTKIRCYTLDHARVTRVQPREKNFHVFYQMMAGLSPQEKGKQKYQSNILKQMCHTCHLANFINLMNLVSELGFRGFDLCKVRMDSFKNGPTVTMIFKWKLLHVAVKYHLSGYTVNQLHYLATSIGTDMSHDQARDAARFHAWKVSYSAFSQM